MTLKLKPFFLIIFSLIFIFPAQAIVENKKITLAEAVEITLKANPNVKIEKLNTQVAQNEIKIANKLQNPSIGTFQNMGSTGKSNPQQIGADYVIEILKRGKRKAYAKTKANIAFDNQKFYEYNLIAEVKKAYIDLLLKKANLKILVEQANLSKELYENAKKDYENGKISKPDVIQAKIALNRSIMYLNVAKSELISSQNRLNLTMNTSEINYDTKEDELNDNFKSLNTISPKAQLPDFETIKNYTLANRYDLLKATKEVESAKENLKIVKSRLIPDLEIAGGWAYQTKGLSEDNASHSGAYAEVNLVNIPLIYRYQPEIKNAQIEIEKAQLNYENVKIDVIRDITDAFEKFTIAKTNLEFYNDELLNNSKELLIESKRSLDKKEIDITNFLVSKGIYLELILGYKAALSEYYISYAELLKEMNTDTLNVKVNSQNAL